MIDIATIPSLEEREFTIGGTKFAATRMGAMEGWRTLEMIRRALASSEVSGVGEASVLRAVLSLPVEFVDQVRKIMFRHVEFATADSTWQPLAGAEDMAFSGLEPLAVYEVLARALAVNFMPSYREAASRLGLAAESLTPR